MQVTNVMNNSVIVDMDASDPLANKRAEFRIPAGRIYLNGNSLGPLTLAARARAQETIDQQWGQDMIASWNRHHWIDLPLTTGAKIAALMGAAPSQVVCCDSVSINLFKLLSCALQLQSDRSTVLSQRDNFPTDLYIVEGLSHLLGKSHCALRLEDADSLERALDARPAVLLLSQVNFRSAELHDIQKLTQAAHEKGTLVIWDLSHSVGVLPLELDQWQVDFAVGCGYKYLNGGPGAPAFLYVAERHLAHISQPLSGWMGHRAPFDFQPSYDACEGIGQFLCGTPPIISMSVLDSALDVFSDVSLAQLRAKSVQLGELFLSLVGQNDSLTDLQLQSPVNAAKRGSQLAFAHPSAYAIGQALGAAGVVADFRSPNILRFGFSPLFLSFADVWESIQILAAILDDERYKDPAFNQRLKVS